MAVKFPTIFKNQEAIIIDVFNGMLKLNKRWDLSTDRSRVKREVFDKIATLYKMSGTTDSYGDFYGSLPNGSKRAIVVDRLITQELDRRKAAELEAGKAKVEKSRAYAEKAREEAKAKEDEYNNSVAMARAELDAKLNPGFLEKYSWVLVIAGVLVGALLLKKILKRKK